MGELSKSVHRNNGDVLGIIPKHLLEIEGINKNYGETIITEDMHTRKKTMYDKSDAFLCLPGGIGTLEEVSETITWFQLNISKKPIFFLNRRKHSTQPYPCSPTTYTWTIVFQYPPKMLWRRKTQHTRAGMRVHCASYAQKLQPPAAMNSWIHVATGPICTRGKSEASIRANTLDHPHFTLLSILIQISNRVYKPLVQPLVHGSFISTARS
mgnify:CR=1 FL=1